MNDLKVVVALCSLLFTTCLIAQAKKPSKQTQGFYFNTQLEKGKQPGGESQGVFKSREQLMSYDPLNGKKLISHNERSIKTFIYISAKAKPGGDGSRNKPFQKINDAVRKMVQALNAGQPTKLVIGPGIYREHMPWFITKQSVNETARKTLLVIEGAGAEKTVISGSVMKDDKHDFSAKTWKLVDRKLNIYSHDWPYDYKPYAGPFINSFGFPLFPPVTQRREMIWLDGEHLRQVVYEKYKWHDPDGRAGATAAGHSGNSENKDGQLIADGHFPGGLKRLDRPMTFMVPSRQDTPANLRGKIFVRLPKGKKMSSYKDIQVALNETARFPQMRLIHKSNLIIRKIGIRHHTAHNMSSALQISRGDNILIEDCDFSNNVAQGLTLNGVTNTVIRRTRANFNGKAGFGMGGSQFVLVEDCETSFNNYRGGWGGYQHWDPSGFKMGNVSNSVFRRHTSIGNKANALWFDVFCKDILVEDCAFIGNTRMGLMFELTRPKGGPLVARNIISAWNGGTGIFLSMAANSAVVRSISVNNGDHKDRGKPYDFYSSQLCFKYAPHKEGNKSSADWQSVILLDNVFASNNKMPLISYGDRKVKPAEMYPWVLQVLKANGNIYHSNTSEQFKLPSGRWGKLRDWQGLLKKHNAPGWQAKHSTMRQLRFASKLQDALTPKADMPLRQLAKERGVPLIDESLNIWRQMHKDGRYEEPYVFYKMQYDLK